MGHPFVREPESDYVYFLRDLGAMPVRDWRRAPGAAATQEKGVLLPEILADLSDQSAYAKQIILKAMDERAVTVLTLRRAA